MRGGIDHAPTQHHGSRGGGVRFLLFALLVSLAALAGLTLSAAAQTGDDGADDADPQGRIIARIQDRTDDGVDDYRIEFGFFPQWAMEDKDPWAEAITTWSDWLPRARYLTKTVIDRRDADDNRRWLRSSLISVPASAPAQQRDGGPDADFEGGDDDQQGLIEGRVVARYNPDSRGRLRVEFGFLPECAFESTSNTEEAVEQYGEDLLPRARYLSASMIESRRGVWLRSSVVDVPSTCDGPVKITGSPHSFGPGQEIEEPVRVGVVVGELTTELDPITFARVPAGLTLSAVDAGVDDDGRPRQNLMLSGTVEAGVGSYSVTITARPATGEPVSETLVIVIGGREQVLRWDNYSPAREEVNDEVTLPAPRVIRGPENPVWSYASDTVDICTVRGTILTLHEEGLCRVTATSAAREGFREGDVDGEITVDGTGPDGDVDVVWRPGYSPTSFAVFGDDAPRLIEPTATVAGRSVRLDYTYEVDEISTDVCEVNSRSGALIAKKAGTCIVIARSVETDDYAAAESRPVRVTITKVRPGLRWSGYDDANLAPGGDPVSPREPQPRVSEAHGELTYTYSATPRSVCSVDRNTGMLTPRSEGRCDVTVNSAETDNFLADEVSVTVDIEELPPRIGAISCPSSADVGEQITCTVRLDPNGGTPDTYSWSGGDSSGSSATYRTSFSSSGDQFVDLTVRNSAGSDSDSTTVTVVSPPHGEINCPSSADVGESITCTMNNRGGEIDSYSWSDSDGGSGSSSSYRTSFSSSGTKTVRLTVRNSAGSNSYSASVRVTPPPPVINSISCPSSTAENENITCTVSLSGGTPDTYSWSDSDGGSSSGPRETTYRTSFSSSGTKTVRLTARNSAGSDSGSASVRVTPPPPVINSISCPSPAEVNENITCTVSLSGGTPDTYSWSDSDGGSGSSSSYRISFSTAGTYTVSLTASNDGGDDSHTYRSITVTPIVTRPDISVSCPASAAENENITCTVSLSGGTPDTYSWSDSDGGSSSGPRETTYRTSFSSSGTKTVSLTARNTAGSDSGSASVRVTPPPPVINSISCPSSAAENENITCTVSLSGGTPDTYSWSDSDGGSGSSSSYPTSFSTEGTYTVSLTVRNTGGGDSDTYRSISVTRTVAPPQVSVNCPSSADVNERIQCTYSRTSGDQATSWSWSDSDGGSGSSSSYSVSFTSAGTKTVYLTASNSGGSGRRSQDSVNVIAGPVINSISCSPSSPTVNQSVSCSASLSGGTPTSYSWSGGSSSGSSASYSTSFSSSGSKTVSLRVSNSAGSDNRSTTVEVQPEPPEIRSITCSPLTEVVDRQPRLRTAEGSNIRCTARTGGGQVTTWAWSGVGSGNNATYSARLNSFGPKTIRLTVSNSGGSDESGPINFQVVATPAPTYGRCGSDRIRVYWFNSSGYDKRWLNMDWADVAARVPGWGEHMIGHMSQSACNSWPNGPDVTTSTWPLP